MATLAEMLREPEGSAETVERPDGTRLFALRAGTGRPVVLAHGVGITHREWSLVMPALYADLRLLPGVGHYVNWENPQAIVDAIVEA